MKSTSYSRRDFLKVAGFSAAAICAGCTEQLTGAAADRKKLNVLFIAIDDLRPELGCYGAPQIKTPNIDKIAAQGVVFQHAYCQVPTCGASRSSLMSGILPTKNRFTTYNCKVDIDTPGAVTLPQVFKQAGYTTISNGKVFHHADDTSDRSWTQSPWRPSGDHYRGSHDPETTSHLSKAGRGRIYEYPDVSDDAYGDGKTAQKTIDDLRRLKSGNKPFFLACGFVRPHMPFYAPKKYWDMYDREKIDIADNRFRPENAPDALRGSGEYKSYHFGSYKPGSEQWHRMMRHGYYACTSYADKLTGDVLNELKRLGLAENTIVVIWGDHGWHLGEHDFWGKHNTMHLALQVPLIIKVPGKVSGKKSAAMIENVDIFPTLSALAGLQTPASVHGRSFDKLFNDPSQKFRNFTYSRFKGADTVITEHFAYTRYSDGQRMLYDHRNDPQENKNVADDPAYKDTVEKMETMLKSRMKVAGQL